MVASIASAACLVDLFNCSYPTLALSIAVLTIAATFSEPAGAFLLAFSISLVMLRLALLIRFCVALPNSSCVLEAKNTKKQQKTSNFSALGLACAAVSDNNC